MYLRKAPEISRRVAATCVGAFTLAEAGLLDGKRVTTHWNYTRELQRRYPKVKVQEDRIFVIDGSVWTSAGMTATIDLVLAMVERDIGPELAQAVAKKMVIHHRRSRRTVAVLGTSPTRAEVRPNSNRSRLRAEKSPYQAYRGKARGGGPSEPPPI